MNIADVVIRDTARAGANTAARVKRGFSFGKGGVGDNALATLDDAHPAYSCAQTYLANRSHPSDTSPMICMTGLILPHMASSIGCFVLS